MLGELSPDRASSDPSPAGAGWDVEQCARLWKALGDPTRLRILNVLAVRPLCVCDIEALLGLSQPTASRHLNLLRQKGLVTSRRDGRFIVYELRSGDGLLQARVLAAVHDSLATCADVAQERAAAEAWQSLCDTDESV